MDYTLDLECLLVQEYKTLLKQQNLLPGRRFLLHNIDENFSIFVSRGIKTVGQLKGSLSTPKRKADMVEKRGIKEEYLIILKREIGSLVQKPVSLSCFPGIDHSLITKLNNAGIKTSKNYWEKNQNISEELYCLCDLVRINGVGPVAAKAFYDAGYRSVTEVAQADATVMLEKISKVNEDKGYYKAKLGIKDMQFCIDFALLLIKYAI